MALRELVEDDEDQGLEVAPAIHSGHAPEKEGAGGRRRSCLGHIAGRLACAGLAGGGRRHIPLTVAAGLTKIIKPDIHST